MRPPVGEGSRQDLLGIFRAAIAAVDPEKLVAGYLRDHPGAPGSDDSELAPPTRSAPSLVVGAGKAAAAMAAGCEKALGLDGLRGLVIVPDGCGRGLTSIDVCEARHPVPDQRAVEATDRVCRLLEGATGGSILCLLSGGASSLLVRPVPPVTLEDKATVTRLLLDSGVDINALNTVRKHLSAVKGGGLLRMTTHRPLSTLLLSDVIGDDPSVIGSGPTAPDPSTYGDAIATLNRARIWESVPDSVRDLLERGRRGELPETVKPGAAAARDAPNVVVGSSRTALAAAAIEARRRGYETIVREAYLAGETSTTARRWYEEIRLEIQSRPAGRYCLLAGGETVVHVRGPGKGGRNQEFALALVPMMEGRRVAVLSAGTDGVDGPTDAAGAFVDGTSARRARNSGLEAAAFLRANDSYDFFRRLGDLFICGPTGTNVMDMKIAITENLSDESRLLKD